VYKRQVLKSCFAFESYQSRHFGGVTPDRVIETLLLDRTLPRSARFSAAAALESVARIDGPGRRSRPHRLLTRLKSMFEQTDTQTIAEHPLGFDAEAHGLIRQLEVAMRETYFHPSKVPSSVMGEEGQGVPQQQQQLTKQRNRW